MVTEIAFLVVEAVTQWLMNETEGLFPLRYIQLTGDYGC